MTGDARVEELARIAQALATAVEPPGADRLLTSLAETARRLLGARACSLALLSDDGTELVYTTAAGDGADAVTGLRLPVSRGIAGWVVQSGQPVAVSDVRADPRFAPDVAASTGYVPRAVVAAPVVADDRVLGVLTVLDRDPDRPGADGDLLLLGAFCEQAAIALESVRSFRDVAGVLLTALHGAAVGGTGLAEQLAVAAQERRADRDADRDTGRNADRDDDLVDLAALLSRLGRHGPDARRLALDVVGDVLQFVEGREGSRPGD